MKLRTVGAAALAVYVGAIFAANWLIVHVGFVHVWPTTLVAPAGVYMAGLTFPARDVVQRGLGRWWGIGAIVLAAGITYLISPTLAVASGVTFLASESLDMLLYTPMQRRLFVWGVAISSTLAAVLDSLLFLYLAHIPYSVALAGQIVGKLEMVWLVGVPVAWALRRTVLPVTVSA